MCPNTRVPGRRGSCVFAPVVLSTVVDVVAGLALTLSA